MDLLFLETLGKPLWMWLAFVLLIAVLPAFDLGILHRRAVVYATPLFLALGDGGARRRDRRGRLDPRHLCHPTDPFIVYASNIFAILGLRALSFALAAMIHRLVYLRHALAAVLVFVGGKISVAEMLGLAKIPPAVSLSVTLAILAAGILASLWSTRRLPGASEAGAGRAYPSEECA